MAVIVALMGRSQDRLKNDFDPGAATQAVQKDIVKQLDAAISSARRQKRSNSNASSSSSDKRSAASQPKTEPKNAKADADAAAEAANTSAAAQAAKSGGSRSAGDLKESRREWGHLPTRDRDEILQGGGERVLPRFQALVKRYFESLAESEQDQP